MTDRELLEKAAKAARIELKFKRYSSNYNDQNIASKTIGEDTPYYGQLPNGWDVPEGYWTAWNPLTDDGDALRLAVKLEMKLYPGEAYPWREDYKDWPIHLGCAVDEDEEPDPYAATRRAIVRAAAAIGETMK